MHGVAQRLAVATAGTVALVGGGHISVGDFAFLLIAAAYILSIVRDWRPVRALREENRELRTQMDELQTKHDALEKKCELLERSRDFGTAFEPLTRAIDQARADSSHEHEKILAALDTLKDGLGELVKGLAQNTAATATLAAGINAGTVGSDAA